jgi:hypothetical protein
LLEEGYGVALAGQEQGRGASADTTADDADGKASHGGIIAKLFMGAIES